MSRGRRPEGVITAVVTPFSLKGAVDLDGLQHQLRWLSGRGLAGVLALGSTGEAPLLSREERRAVIGACDPVREEGALLLAGTGAESTRLTIQLTRDAALAGADAALVMNPSYYRSRMTVEALEQHYLAVADASEIPVLLYSVPKFTNLALTPELVERLAPHPNIVGMKDSSGDLRTLHTFLERTPPEFDVVTGSSEILGPSVMAGASGAILAVANFCPDLCVELHEAAGGGDIERVRGLQAELNALTRRIQSVHGIPGLKAAADLVGGFGGHPRAPMLGLDEAGREAVEAALSESGLLDPPGTG